MKTTPPIAPFLHAIHSVLRMGMILRRSLLVPGVWAGTDQAPWFSNSLVGMEVGPTGAQFAGGKHAPDYAKNFNGTEIVRRCAAANAEYLVLWVRDGDYTFHDSKWIPKPASFGDRDVLREAVEEGRKLNLPIIAYGQLQYPAHELRQHPEWKARQANGEPINHLVCFNTPDTNVVKTLLAEMMAYGIAGFHLDMVDQGFGPPHGCWYFSVRSRDWVGRDKPAAWFQSVQGAHKACVYEHLGFGFLFDEGLTLEGLKQFPVVCLPNVGILSEREVELFRRYVEDGGKLLITGQSGQFDRRGKPLATSTLENLIGAKVNGRREDADSWMRSAASRIPGSGTMLFADTSEGKAARRKALHAQNSAFAPALLRSGPADWPFLIRGPATVYEPTTATPVGELLDSHRASLANPQGYNADWPLSARQVVGPAVLINSVGRGTVLTFAGSPDAATAGEHHIVEARKLLANAVRLLNPTPRIQVHAPANVEVVVTDAPATRTLRVHLIAYNATPQTTPVKERPYVLPGLIEDAPIFRANIELRDGLKDARALNRSTQLKKRGNRVELAIADIHEVIQCRY